MSVKKRVTYLDKMVKETLASLGNKSLRSNSSDDKVAGRDVRPQSRVMIADVELSSPLSRMSKANKLKNNTVQPAKHD